MSLWKTCKAAVGKRVWYKGTNGDEYDKKNHGKPVEGVGVCTGGCDSHGLCIIVKNDDGTTTCVDPTDVLIQPKYRSIDA